MKIFNAAQCREWDAYTMIHEPIAAIDLMERAATRCAEWMLQHGMGRLPIHIFCGKGNNGGDGLALARLLLQQGCTVHAYVLEFGHKGTPDFQTNLHRLHVLTTNIHFIQSEQFFPALKANEVVVDAILGTGLSKPLEGVTEKLVLHLNHAGATGIAIDIPTGMFADSSCRNQTVFHATHTLTFQHPKTCFFMQENQDAAGNVQVLDIGLHPAFEQLTTSSQHMVDHSMAAAIRRHRKPFAHKGNFGHALLVAGSRGKMGAAVLAAGGVLRSGAGLLTCQVPGDGLPIIQTALPEAMALPDPHPHHLTTAPASLVSFAAVGMGPGLGLQEATAQLVLTILENSKGTPMVLDADALNILSAKQNLSRYIHNDCILTPHPREFERLFGASSNDFEQMQKAREQAMALSCVIVLKSHHSLIAFPDGQLFFNSTGNAGMATGGSGDVLTGVITGLLAQGYSCEEAALLGVYLHGLAGDVAAAAGSEESLLAGDLLQHMGAAFRKLN